jgi:hypothetical protein
MFIKTDPLHIFWHIVISFALTCVIIYIAKLFPINKRRTTYIAFIFAGFYILVSQLLLPGNTLTAKLDSITPQPGFLPASNHRSGVSTPLFTGIDVEPGTFPDSVIKIHDAEIPVMGPLDGLSPEDVNTRLTYMYRKTAYPYRPMTYFDFVTDSDKQLAKAGPYQVLNSPTEDTGFPAQRPGSAVSLSLTGTETPRRPLSEYRQEMERWYPTLTKDQINVRDCTNFAPGSPGSCLIKPELLDAGSKVLVENFESYSSMPKSLDIMKTIPTLFKNAPDYHNADYTETVSDISHNISRGGVVGQCRTDYCGSRVLEPGSDNIVDVGNMFRAYLLPF